MSWLGKILPYVGLLERQVEELRAVNQRLTDQLLRVTGDEPIYEQGSGNTEQGPVRTRQTMEEYLKRLEAEEQRLLHDEIAAVARGDQASSAGRKV